MRLAHSADLPLSGIQAVLAQVRAGAEALSKRQHSLAQQHFLAAAEGLCLLARRSEGDLRRRQVDLASRLYLQATQLAPGALPELALLADHAGAEMPADPALPRLADVVGNVEAKAIFRSRYIYPLQHPELARAYRQTGAGGTLMFGPPGTGKTLLARALAGELNAPVFVIRPADILSKWLGDAEKHLAEVFATARRHDKALMFWDEIDALAPSRDQAENNKALQRLLTQLLTELDGFQQSAGRLMFLAATNRPWDVDIALLRSGRFDSLAYVGLPDAPTREAMLEMELKGIPLAKAIDLGRIARQADYFSGAEMRTLAQQAARLAFHASVEHGQALPVRQATLEQALWTTHRMATPELLARYEAFRRKHAPDTDRPPQDKEAQPSAKPKASAEPVEFDPLRQVHARDLAIEIELLPFICYALQHVGIPPIRRLAVHNRGQEESQNLVVEVALTPDDFGTPWVGNIAELQAGETWRKTDIALPLKLDRLRAVQEKERAHVRVTVRDRDEVLYADTREIPVLAYNEWLFLPEFLEFTAAFVQPNAPALHPVIEKAADRLEKITGRRAFSGYQNGAEHVRHMLAALHDTLAMDLELDYINPPPSFEGTGQKVRLVADTLAQGRGTCFDLAILQAALWEHVGLHPCLVLIPGHAFMACWMESWPNEQSEPPPVTQFDGVNAGQLHRLVDSGRLLPVNSVEITSRHPLEAAVQAARRILEQTLAKGGVVGLIDLRAARRKVTPLP